MHIQNVTDEFWFWYLQPEGLSQVADLVSFYKENATILRNVSIPLLLRIRRHYTHLLGNSKHTTESPTQICHQADGSPGGLHGEQHCLAQWYRAVCSKGFQPACWPVPHHVVMRQLSLCKTREPCLI